MALATILAGGLSPFIHYYLLNTTAGTLSHEGNFRTGGNSSWISLHPAEEINISGLYGRVL
jgi:hypothetical protein